MPPCATEAALGILTDPIRNVNSFFQKKKNSLLKSAGGCAIIYKLSKSGGLAQLVRASASHAEGRRFESAALHQQRGTGFVPVPLCSKGRTRSREKETQQSCVSRGRVLRRRASAKRCVDGFHQRRGNLFRRHHYFNSLLKNTCFSGKIIAINRVLQRRSSGHDR